MSKEAKKGVTVQLGEDVVLTLQRLAAQQGVSVSKLGGEMLEAGLKIGGEKAAEMLLLPKLEAALRAELSLFAHRHAKLLSRSVIEAGITRRLLRGFLRVQAGDVVAGKAEERARQETVIELKSKGSAESAIARDLAQALTADVDVVSAAMRDG
jgi:hypothetical protein